MRHRATAFFLLFAAVLAGCGSSRDKEIQRVLDSPIDYNSHLSPWANMNDYATWNWVPIPKDIPFDPRAKDAATRTDVESRVTRHMEARG